MNGGWLLSGMILLPLLLAPVVGTRSSTRVAQRLAAAVALATLLGSGALFALYHLSGVDGFLTDPLTQVGGMPMLGLDHLSAVLLPFVSLLAVAAAMGAPRGELSPASLGRLLATQGSYVGLFLALDLRLFAFFWVSALAPIYLELRKLPDHETRRRTSRMFMLFPMASSLPLLASLFLMHQGGSQEGLAHPFSIPELLRRGLPIATETATFGLLWVTILVRAGVAPMHSWLPSLFERAPFWVALMMGSLKPGLYLLLRLSWRLLPHASERWLGVLTVVGLGTALYGALLGLGQRSLRGLVGALAVSNGGLMLAGLCSRSIEGETGGLTQWIAIGAAMAGLSLVVWALEARTGTSSPDDLGGIANRAPALSFCFLLFGLIALGLPGTLSFIGEDLLLHGGVSTHPAHPVVLALASVLNACAVMRAYTRTFLGRARSTFEITDLLPRERFAAMGLVALLVIGSLIPGTLVREESKAIDSDIVHRAGGHGAH